MQTNPDHVLYRLTYKLLTSLIFFPLSLLLLTEQWSHEEART